VPPAAPNNASGGATKPHDRAQPATTPPTTRSSEIPAPRYLTVGHLLHQFQDLDPSLPIRLAINPDFPFVHYLGAEVAVPDGKAFIAACGPVASAAWIVARAAALTSPDSRTATIAYDRDLTALPRSSSAPAAIAKAAIDTIRKTR